MSIIKKSIFDSKFVCICFDLELSKINKSFHNLKDLQTCVSKFCEDKRFFF